jgi:microcystin-dependent protein
MSFRSCLDQRTELTGVFYDNSTCTTYDNTETNLSLLASLQYVINFTNYFIYATYLQPTNPAFQGLMNGQNITLSGNLSTPTISNPCNFTNSPTVNNQNIEYDIIGEVKMVINEIPPNYLLCDGANYPTSNYPYLFNIIGYTYGGSGDNFNVPNFESKFPIGANSISANGNPTSNFAYGNGISGANNTETVSYEINTLLMTQMPSHSHSVLTSNHLHSTQTQTDTNVYFLTSEEFTLPFIVGIGSSSLPPIETYTATTGVSLIDTGINILATDPVSGLNGVNLTPSYISVKYAICFIQNY